MTMKNDRRASKTGVDIITRSSIAVLFNIALISVVVGNYIAVDKRHSARSSIMASSTTGSRNDNNKNNGCGMKTIFARAFTPHLNGRRGRRIGRNDGAKVRGNSIIHSPLSSIFWSPIVSYSVDTTTTTTTTIAKKKTILRSSSEESSSFGSLFQDSYFDSLTTAGGREADSVGSRITTNNSNSSNDNIEDISFSIADEREEFESLVEAATVSSTGTVLGGDFAGLAATFCPGTGEFIPLPEHLIPESLLEWGQEPKCLEVLVSEDLVPSDESYRNESDDGDSTSTMMMERVTTTVLPDTGCSVDNLETIKAVDEIDLSTGTLIHQKQWEKTAVHLSSDIGNGKALDSDSHSYDHDRNWDDHAVVALKYPLISQNTNDHEKNELRLETIFGLDDDETRRHHRLRVVIDLQIESSGSSNDNDRGVQIGVQKPMMIMLERRTSSVSSGGTIGDGGGLDGRTVSLLLGDRLRSSQTFVDTEPPLGQSYEDETTGIRYVALPSNILLAYGWVNNDEQWTIQIGHVEPSMGTYRRVVSRTFTETSDGNLDFEIDNWVEQTVPSQQEDQEDQRQSQRSVVTN